MGRYVPKLRDEWHVLHVGGGSWGPGVTNTADSFLELPFSGERCVISSHFTRALICGHCISWLFLMDFYIPS
jgi:hypothetical protein